MLNILSAIGSSVTGLGKPYLIAALVLALSGSYYYVYDSGYDNGANAEKVIYSELVINQQRESNERVRLLAEYSNGLTRSLRSAEEEVIYIAQAAIEPEADNDQEVIIYVQKEAKDQDGIVWLGPCFVRLHNNAAAIASSLPKAISNTQSACLDNDEAVKLQSDRPNGYFTSGEALKIITYNYHVARSWRMQLIALQEREKVLQNTTFKK